MFAFSNFQPWPFVYQDVDYPTLEHWYQAMKVVDLAQRRAIAALPTPGAAKRAGRQLPVRGDWDDIKVAAMRWALARKFAPGSAYGATLAQYEGPIVEWNTWHDTFWGKCTCSTHGGVGENWLGQLLEEQRSALGAFGPPLKGQHHDDVGTTSPPQHDVVDSRGLGLPVRRGVAAPGRAGGPTAPA